MIGESFSSALARFKSNKDIFWLGPQHETPGSDLSELLPRIQFALVENAEKYLPRKPLKFLILSAPEQIPNQVQLEGLLNQLSPHVIKLLVLSANESSDLSAHIKQLINNVGFTEIILNKNEIAGAIRRFEQVAIEDNNTAQLEAAKFDLESRVVRVKALVHFLKNLSTVESIDQLLSVLKKELELIPSVKEPILVHSTRNRQSRIWYFQGATVMNRLMSGPWPEVLLPRINDKKDSQYLADLFVRPFARVIAVPFAINRTGGDFERVTPGVLYFEHSLDDLERAEFIDFVHERLHPMSAALDRIFLEKDLTEASMVWERTFDGLADPIAIFDRDGKLLRANKIFNNLMGEISGELFESKKIRVSDRIFDIHKYPIVGGRDDTTSNIVVHCVDITVSQELQKQLVQQEKMAALGHLAGNIAHELNNPLTGIRSLSQVLIAQIPDEDRRRGDLIEVESAAARCQSIIKNLLDFASGTGQREWVSLNDVVNKTLPFLKTLIRNFEVVKNFSEEDVSIFVEPQLMQQVAFNLIKNACQAMTDNGKLTIQTRRFLQDGLPYCELAISDTGPGMTETIKNQIFNFFFTTKKSGQGTGLGLSLCKSIVDRYGGHIVVDSEVGKGSHFYVRIPKREN